MTRTELARAVWISTGLWALLILAGFAVWQGLS